MDWLRRVFAFGRLQRAPTAHTAGRVLPPASVQRTHLGLAQVDLPAGVVTLRGGEVRAILRVAGVPLHHRSPEEARAFLVGWANALNALPPGRRVDRPVTPWWAGPRHGGQACAVHGPRAA